MTQDSLLSEDNIEKNTPSNFLESLVGDNKKFKSPEELAKGKWEADKYIEFKNKEFDELKSDYLQLRKELDSRASVEDLIDRMSKSQQTQDGIPNPNANTEKPSIDSAQIESLVDSKLAQRETQRQYEQNFKMVRDKLQEVYGNNWQTPLKEHMDRLNLDPQFVDTMARQHPTAFIRTFGLDNPRSNESFQAPPSSEQNTGFGKDRTKRSWAYYQEIKKADPKKYYDSQTQLQLMRDAEALGDDFKDGDFHRYN